MKKTFIIAIITIILTSGIAFAEKKQEPVDYQKQASQLKYENAVLRAKVMMLNDLVNSYQNDLVKVYSAKEKLEYEKYSKEADKKKK